MPLWADESWVWVIEFRWYDETKYKPVYFLDDRPIEEQLTEAWDVECWRLSQWPNDPKIADFRLSVRHEDDAVFICQLPSRCLICMAR